MGLAVSLVPSTSDGRRARDSRQASGKRRGAWPSVWMAGKDTETRGRTERPSTRTGEGVGQGTERASRASGQAGERASERTGREGLRWGRGGRRERGRREAGASSVSVALGCSGFDSPAPVRRPQPWLTETTDAPRQGSFDELRRTAAGPCWRAREADLEQKRALTVSLVLPYRDGRPKSADRLAAGAKTAVDAGRSGARQAGPSRAPCRRLQRDDDDDGPSSRGRARRGQG